MCQGFFDVTLDAGIPHFRKMPRFAITTVSSLTMPSDPCQRLNIACWPLLRTPAAFQPSNGTLWRNYCDKGRTRDTFSRNGYLTTTSSQVIDLEIRTPSPRSGFDYPGRLPFRPLLLTPGVFVMPSRLLTTGFEVSTVMLSFESFCLRSCMSRIHQLSRD